MNKTKILQSCLLPFKVHLDFGNDVFIFLFILTCMILALLFGYLLLKHKMSTADQAKNFIELINEDLFYLYLGMLLPIVSLLIDTTTIECFGMGIFKKLLDLLECIYIS